MHDLDEELWKLGVPAKTKHNEVAPAQHELAPVYDTANIAVDHNQLTMEMMKLVADRHGLACLLHEKPFEGINGSGKHNNRSLITNTGANLLYPGRTPAENTKFLVFLMAVIKAVDEYADLLRVSVATAGNDHRLGANEAPPAIVSVFLGDELTAVLKSIENDEYFGKQEKVAMQMGTSVIPQFFKDTTDRNRTSPFAFTGNKFEFRMPGSSANMSDPNTVLNTAVAQALREFYDELKDAAPDGMDAAVHELVKRAIKKHKKVIFKGNGYTDEWVAEAERRGLYNLRSTPEALPCMVAENIRLFTSHHIFTEGEVRSRYAILLENYCKTLHVEAKTMGMMVRGQFLPAVLDSMDHLAASINGCKAAAPAASCAALQIRLEQLAASYGKIDAAQSKLEEALAKAEALGDGQEAAWFYHDEVLPAMDDVRSLADAAEVYLPAGALPYPDYSELLFSV